MTPRTRRSSWPVVKELCGSYTKWFVAIWLCLFIIVALILAGFAIFGDPSSSVLDNATMGPRYWIFSLGAVLTFASLRMYVAHGVTRRTFIIAGTVTAVVAPVVVAGLTVFSYFAESRVYAAQGWSQALGGTHLFTRADQFGLIFCEFALVYMAHFFAGWLLGSLFYRLGVWAVPFVLLGYGGAVATEGVLGTGWIGAILSHNMPRFSPSPSIAVPVGLCLIIGMAVANWAVLRRIAIAPKKS